MEPDLIELRHYHHGHLPDGFRQLLLDVHADVYAAEMDDPFVQRFPWFVDHWSSREGFVCAVGYDDEEPAGYAYGAPLTAPREWWRKHIDLGSESSTFGVSELMVRDHWRKTGASQQLHDALLANRKEHIAAICFDVSHPKVQALYESWGYHKVGEDQPFADSPVLGVMVKRLR
jgi:GNAT superfamily N-acetyltransferase